MRNKVKLYIEGLPADLDDSNFLLFNYTTGINLQQILQFDKFMHLTDSCSFSLFMLTYRYLIF